MANFKRVAAVQLLLLFVVFLMGTTSRALSAEPSDACGRDLYLRVVLAHHVLFLAAAALLLAVRVAVSAAEARAVAAARAAAAADGDSKAFDADREAAAAAVKGVGSVAARWKRVSLRATLLLAVVLAAAASFLAIVAVPDGFRCRICCNPRYYGWYGAGRAMGAVMMCLMLAVHGYSAWVAVSQN